MAVITVPDDELIVLDSIDLDAPAQVNRSQWTGRRKVVGMPGASLWYFSFHVVDITTEILERPWRAFLVQLDGVVNKFRLRVACSQRTGSNPTVRTGAGNGNTIPLQGLPASSTVLSAGQYMTVRLPSGHERLVLLIQDLSSNGSGQGTAVFEPTLNEVPNSGSVVETINPWALVSLPQSRNGWTISDGVTGLQFNAEEAP